MSVSSGYCEKVLKEVLSEGGVGYDTNHAGTHFVLKACPVCSQGKKLFVDIRDGRFICHNCIGDGVPTKGGLAYFISLVLNQPISESFKRLKTGRKISNISKGVDILSLDYLKKVRQVYELGSHNKASDDDCYSLPEIKLPPGAVRIKEGSPAFKYLTEKRNLPVEFVQQVEAYEIPATDAEELRKLTQNLPTQEKNIAERHSFRVIFVQEVLGKIVGYVSRDFSGKRSKKEKVLNSTGGWRNHCLWNFDVAKTMDRIIVLEGIISAAMCGPEAVATYGAEISENQLSLLLKSKAKEIVIMSEVGAYDNAYVAASKLIGNKVVKIVLMPEVRNNSGDSFKDCADYTYEENMQLIEDTPYLDDLELMHKMKEIEAKKSKAKDFRNQSFADKKRSNIFKKFASKV